jgi:hypothetical protein
LGNTSWANDTWDVITRGDCNTLSFGFIPYEVENRSNLRYLKSVGLKEVSFCVSQPAYPETNSVSALRKIEDKNMKNKKLVTRSIDVEYLTDILASGELITDKEVAQELLSLIDPELVKELTTVEENAPAEGAERDDTDKTETEEEKKDVLEEIEKELLSFIKEIEEENEDESE